MPGTKTLGGANGPKVSNKASGTAAKLDMRRAVLRELGADARVFEAFCGDVGIMSAAWAPAKLLEGCDLKFRFGEDVRRRYVGDSRVVMRAIDLARFNVFDVDAYGSPWEHMAILELRRKWAKGERGAVVLTDGQDLKIRLGGRVPAALARYVGAVSLPPGAKLTRALFDQALHAWMQRSGVVQVTRFDVTGVRGQPMIYAGAVFEGA